jgi:hypothetical protein
LNLKRHISLIVLIGFFIALSPRDWWHECDNHNEIEHSGDVHFEKDKCFACDFDLGEIESPFQYQFHFVASVNSFDQVDEVFSFNSTRLGFSHRGPPNFV